MCRFHPLCVVKTTKTENDRVVAKIVQDKAPKELKVSKKKIADTLNENGPVVPNIVEDKPVKEPEIRKEKIVDTAKEKKVVPLTTTQDSIDVEVRMVNLQQFGEGGGGVTVAYFILLTSIIVNGGSSNIVSVMP
jgi:hypothetical protein